MGASQEQRTENVRGRAHGRTVLAIIPQRVVQIIILARDSMMPMRGQPSLGRR